MTWPKPGITLSRVKIVRDVRTVKSSAGTGNVSQSAARYTVRVTKTGRIDRAL